MRYYVRFNRVTMLWDVLTDDPKGLFAVAVSSHETQRAAEDAQKYLEGRATPPSGESQQEKGEGSARRTAVPYAPRLRPVDPFDAPYEHLRGLGQVDGGSNG